MSTIDDMKIENLEEKIRVLKDVELKLTLELYAANAVVDKLTDIFLECQ